MYVIVVIFAPLLTLKMMLKMWMMMTMIDIVWQNVLRDFWCWKCRTLCGMGFLIYNSVSTWEQNLDLDGLLCMLKIQFVSLSKNNVLGNQDHRWLNLAITWRHVRVVGKKCQYLNSVLTKLLPKLFPVDFRKSVKTNENSVCSQAPHYQCSIE